METGLEGRVETGSETGGYDLVEMVRIRVLGAFEAEVVAEDEQPAAGAWPEVARIPN